MVVRMNEKLKLLLNKINMETEEFEGGKLSKIISSKNKKKCTFFISLEKPLNNQTYNDFLRLLSDYFNVNVDIKITVENFTLEQIREYYVYYLKEYSKNAPLLKTFIDSNLFLENNQLSEIELCVARAEKYIEAKDVSNSAGELCSIATQLKLLYTREKVTISNIL